MLSILSTPFRWIGTFFVNYGYGRYSMPASIVAAFFMFTMTSAFLNICEYCLVSTHVPADIIKLARVCLLALVIGYLQLGLWMTSGNTHWFFRLCMRLLIINNSVVLGVFLMTSFGVLHIDTMPVMTNPNVPVRIH